VRAFVARQRRCIPCSSAVGTCAPRGTSASVPRRGSNTRPSGRRSPADSWPADRGQPSRGRCLPCSPRGSSAHSCRPPGRPSVLQTGAHGRTSGSPTVSRRMTTRHSSSKTRPVMCTITRPWLALSNLLYVCVNQCHPRDHRNIYFSTQ